MTIDEVIKALKVIRKDFKDYRKTRQNTHDSWFMTNLDHPHSIKRGHAKYAGDELTKGGYFRVGNVAVKIAEIKELK